MRFLFVSNMYPPHAVGGYEQLCKEIAEAFVERGHEVTVLTARQHEPFRETLNGVSIHRVLNREVEDGMLQTAWRLAVSRTNKERENVAVTARLLEQIRPDAALIWGMWNIPRSVPATIESLLPHTTAYYFLDYWPSLPNAYIQRLQEPSRRDLTSIPKRIVAKMWLPDLQREAPPVLALRHTACVSNAVRNKLVELGIPVDEASVIHLGVRPDDVPPPAVSAAQNSGAPLTVVYAGRLTADKGVHTAIEAMRILRHSGNDSMTLDVYGTGVPDYVSSLRRLVVDEGLPVTFQGQVSRNRLLQLLPFYDVMVFPSIWQEPFAHAVLEGMAAGLAVVGTTTGGTGEVLVDRETGLAFEPGNARKLAECLTQLARDPALRGELSRRGRDKVLTKFTFAQTVLRLESFLEGIANDLTGRQSRQSDVIAEQSADST